MGWRPPRTLGVVVSLCFDEASDIALMPLGDAFWGNFLLIDDEHSEFVLQSQLWTLQPVLQPVADALDVSSLDRAKAVELLRRNGFHIPTAAGKRLCCTWCWQSRTCNSSALQAHLVTCSFCPEPIKCKYRQAALESKSASSYFGASQLAAAPAPPPLSQSAGAPRRQSW